MSESRLTAKEAREFMNIKKDNFEKTLGIIRQMCDTLLKDTCRKGHNSMRFDVPATIWARESYNQQEMGKALAEQLYQDGFDITGTTTKLHISWKREIKNERPLNLKQQLTPAVPSVGGRGARKKKVEKSVRFY